MIKSTISYTLMLAAIAIIVTARMKGYHMTEGEQLVEYWPMYLGAFGCGAASVVIGGGE